MEGMFLGLNAGPQRPEGSASPEPEREHTHKKKRSREEKEARREAKRIKRESGISQTTSKDPHLVDSSGDDIDGAVNEKKRTKEEKLKRKAEKAERKARKSSDHNNNDEHENGDEEQKNPKTKIPVTVSSKVIITPINNIKSSPSSQVSKRERSQTTPLVSISQIGESSTPTKKPSILTAKAVRSPISAKKASSSSSTKKQVSTPEAKIKRPRNKQKDSDGGGVDDLTLKARLTDQNAVYEYLANNWVSDNEIRRLERVGILQYKKGKLSEDEKIAIRGVLDAYKKTRRLNDDQLVEAVMAGATTFHEGRDAWQSFWLEIAAACPGRPVRYMQKAVQRMYDPNGHKGHFTPEEDAMLIRAYELHPNQWGKIAEIVERTYHDCRDRYTKELQFKETKQSGEWSKEEIKKLTECIAKMNRSLGRENQFENENIPWNLVVKEMGNTRTVVQCRKKWSDEIYPKIKWGWEKGHDRENDFNLILRLELLKYPSEKHINWKEVRDETLEHMTSHQMRQMYYRLKNKVPDADNLKFSDLVKKLSEAAASLKHINRPTHPHSKGHIDSSDEEDELEDEEGSNEKTTEIHEETEASD
ncbi:uncharacterized protein L201_003240 [Kwoniella dendrophila CBS 6074]|uniref:Myb-like domain-containing protein n=1 Tax=Kwoniella dendrophila CBS 6074 TaxID=1295534 RepID=A0AAX4JSG7_9TREE